MPRDLMRLRPDFVVAVGYKWMLGPFSIGYMYIAEQHRDGEPLEESWINRAGSDDFAAVADYTDEYFPGARRFDVGQRGNFGLLPMSIVAVEQLLDWGVANIAGALREVTDAISARLASLGLHVGAP